jgi:hypothetical protein
VTLVSTNVSEKRVASIIRVLVISNVVARSPILLKLIIEATLSSEKVRSYKIHTASHPRSWHSTLTDVC